MMTQKLLGHRAARHALTAAYLRDLRVVPIPPVHVNGDVEWARQARPLVTRAKNRQHDNEREVGKGVGSQKNSYTRHMVHKCKVWYEYGTGTVYEFFWKIFQRGGDDSSAGGHY